MLRTKPITPRRTKSIVPIGPIVIAPDEATSPGETRLVRERSQSSRAKPAHQTKPGSRRAKPTSRRAKPIEPSEVIASKGVGCCHENKVTAFRILPNSPIFLDLRVPQGGMTNCSENFSGWALGFVSMTFGLFPEHKSTLVVRGSPRRKRRTRIATACGLISLARAIRGHAPTTRWSLLRGRPRPRPQSGRLACAPTDPGTWSDASTVRRSAPSPEVQRGDWVVDHRGLSSVSRVPGQVEDRRLEVVDGDGDLVHVVAGEGCGVAQGRGEAWQVGHGHGVQVEQTRSTWNSVGGFEASLTVREGHQHFDVLSGSAQGSTGPSGHVGKADFLGETAADPLDVDNPSAAPDNRGACPQVDDSGVGT